ncbi:Integral membrane protein sed5 [Tritrichomonas foetus]|uniref:Integral membrane protein sed5 n=1 Tax=Tritrichomonas foetus TaxID=1144522 RepID=A0A1J4JXD0_9EUKA|nr:Integral membrane protein sed5 [Tritrichomonas foetus]|eukprot:OHT01933.1 Integral membrane protein sed5 [Tritrichomonas foetus]
MNRTSEFFSYLSRENHIIKNKVHVPVQKSQFSEVTNEIRQRLSHSRDSVRELHIRLRKGTIFGEDEQRINEIIISLNRDLAQIEAKISGLSSIKTKPQNYKNAIQTLQQSLSGITKDFQVLIQRRSQIMQKVAERRQLITAPTRGSNFFDTMYTDEVEYPINNLSNQQLEEHRERYDMVRNVEQSISEIVTMYQKLSEVVASQEFDIQRIDQNANETLDGLLKGTKQLEKFYEKTKHNRWLIMKIAAVLVFFALVFIIII